MATRERACLEPIIVLGKEIYTTPSRMVVIQTILPATLDNLARRSTMLPLLFGEKIQKGEMDLKKAKLVFSNLLVQTRRDLDPDIEIVNPERFTTQMRLDPNYDPGYFMREAVKTQKDQENCDPGLIPPKKDVEKWLKNRIETDLENIKKGKRPKMPHIGGSHYDEWRRVAWNAWLEFHETIEFDEGDRRHSFRTPILAEIGFSADEDL